jgi:hypothetical protein
MTKKKEGGKNDQKQTHILGGSCASHWNDS